MSSLVMHLHKANGPSTWWLEGATSGLGLKKLHSSIPLKAHGQGPTSHHGLQSTRTGPWVVLTGDGPLCMGGYRVRGVFRENASS
jgi:hypothetical protein